MSGRKLVTQYNFSDLPLEKLIIRHGLGVRIAGSHPAGPGSIPGVGTESFLKFVK